LLSAKFQNGNRKNIFAIYLLNRFNFDIESVR
jgi:hypothetical protein